MKPISILFTILFTGSLVSAQKNFWKSLHDTPFVEEIEAIKINKSDQAKVLSLNVDQLKEHLNQLHTKNKELSIKFPNSEGTFNTYRIKEESVLHPDLQAKYPSIKTYSGYNVNDPSENINFSISQQFGLNAAITNNKKTDLIDSYTRDKKGYVIYDKSKVKSKNNNFICHVEEKDPHPSLGLRGLEISPEIRNLTKNNKLKTLRLAITTTTEYSNYIIDQANLNDASVEQQKEAILAAITISINRVSNILKNDVGIKLELIPNTDLLFFLTNDTFNINNARDMLFENINVTNQIIGLENYDIGHLFFKVNTSNLSNGLASTPSVCTINKAGGVTGTVTPIGDPFDVDYTAHEIGHQLGAYHTQSNNCNRTNSSAVEPGSGSTIMAYTGICAPNIQRNSDPYYHHISISQITHNLQTISCGTETEFYNLPPSITLDRNIYEIPHSTAFALEMNASDPNNDNLTFSWEQIDTTIPEQMPQLSSNTNGPMFRSFPPSLSPIRFFPKMENILDNKIVINTNLSYNAIWEVMPNNPRTLTFAATVRDNNPNIGLTDSQIVTVNLNNVGPFKVTSQNIPETWNIGAQKTITWDVAGTTTNNINTTAVKIILSLDGGQTWNYTLVESTPNNGSYTFTVPPGIGETTNARIMIKPVDNIYLAVNQSNFTIHSPLASNDLETESTQFVIYPNPSNGEFYIDFPKKYDQITVKVYDMTGRQVAQSKSTQVSIKSHKINLNHLTNGIYIIKIQVDQDSFSKKIIIKK